MQITMRRVDDIGDLDRSFTPYEDTGFRNYIKDRYEKATEYLSRAGDSVSKAFMDRSRDIYERINSSDALRRTRATIRSAMSSRDPSRIYRMTKPEEVRAAGHGMQRWLMADPVIRESYHRQLSDGYSDTYTDQNPKDIGNDHYDYRRVINGMYMQEKDANGESILTHTTFHEVLLEDDRELDMIEQSDILDSWEVQRMMFAMGLDPNNRLGGNLS